MTDSVLPKKPRYDVFVAPFIALCVSCAALSAAKGPSCQVIKLADEACVLVAYTDETGASVQQTVTSADLARVAKAAHAATRRPAGSGSSSGSAAPSSPPPPLVTGKGVL